MISDSIIWAAGLLVLVTLVGVESHRTCKFRAIYNFGDSNSDTGSKSAAIEVVPPPKGETFFHKPAGRLCDGRLVIDFIGSSIRPGGYCPFHLGIQINQFIRFKYRTIELYEQHGATGNLPRPEEDFSKSLYMVDVGQNDLSYGFQYNTPDQVSTLLADILSQFASALQELYKEGARNFWIHNTDWSCSFNALGCLPYTIIFYRPKSSELDRIGCVETLNYVAREFNRRLKQVLDKLSIEHPKASFTHFDMYTAKYELFSHAKKQGLNDPLAFCCGSYCGYQIRCGETAVVNGTLYGKPCPDPSRHVSWDGTHNTEASNRKIATHIIKGSLSTPAIAIQNACKWRGV